MQRRVDGQDMGQEVAASVDQAVEPLEPDRSVEGGLDSEGRVVECTGVVYRAIAPHCRHRHSCRQDLLSELPDRDFIVVNLPAPGAGHRRRATKGIWYFGIDRGAREPPGIAIGKTCRTLPLQGISRTAPATPV